MAKRKPTLKQILAEAFKQGLIRPNTLADVQRLAYGMNTRITVNTAPAKHADRCALKCRHGLKPGKGTTVQWNGLHVLLCGSCAPKVKAGAMIVSLRHKKAYAARAGR